MGAKGKKVDVVQFFWDGIQQDIFVYVGSSRTLKSINRINLWLTENGREGLVFDDMDEVGDDMKVSHFYGAIKERLEGTELELLWNETDLE